MGNRVVIGFIEPSYSYNDPQTGRKRTVKASVLSYGLFLHWNGGMDSIEAFLEVINETNRGQDMSYMSARMCELIGRFFGGNLSLGMTGFEDKQRRALAKYPVKESDETEAGTPDALLIDAQISTGDNGVVLIGWDKDQGYHVAAHFQGYGYQARWSTLAELKAERDEARNGDYFHPENGKKSLPDTLREVLSYNAHIAGKDDCQAA